MDRQRKLSSLTVVAPYYNEEAGLQVFYQKLTRQLDKLDLQYDLVFVDDGSQDQTLVLLNQLADQDSRITVLSLSRNFGHQVALTAGLDYAQGEAVVVMDSDLQHPPEAIPPMIEEYEGGADIVYAVRRNAKDLGFVKRATASAYYATLERVADVRIIRGAADFRLMSGPVVSALRRMRETHRFLRGMVPWLGFPHAVIHYDQPDRYAGRPAYTWRKSMRLAKHGWFSFSTLPLELATWLGILLTGLGTVYLVYIIGVALFGQPVPGWASVIAAVLVIGGVQLISLGILAQYVGMLFEQVKNRPLYVLKQERVGTGHAADRGGRA